MSQNYSTPSKSAQFYETSTASALSDSNSSDDKYRHEFYNEFESEDQRRCLRNLNEVWCQIPGGITQDMQDDLESFEIDVKPKKRAFQTVDEKKKFIEGYTKKKKTELCKNFQLKGSCNFGEKCSFAHGKHELKEKTHLHSNFKTKPCKQLFYEGKCNYGYRCQYLHNEIKYVAKYRSFLISAFKERDIPLRYSNTEDEKLDNLANLWGSLRSADINVESFFSKAYKNKRRLEVFKNICSQEHKSMKKESISDCSTPSVLSPHGDSPQNQAFFPEPAMMEHMKLVEIKKGVSPFIPFNNTVYTL